MNEIKHDYDNARRSSELLEAIAYVLFLETWLTADEGLKDLNDEMLTNLNQNWREEWLPKRNAEHYGDCTKVAGACIRCSMDSLFANAARILASHDMPS